MRDATVLSWYARRHLWQSPVNSVPIPPRRAQRDLVPSIAVVVRVAWPDDGVELIEARAAAWTRTAVLCHWSEPRLQILGAWFPPHELRRLDAIVAVEERPTEAGLSPVVRPAGLEPATRGLKVPCSAS